MIETSKRCQDEFQELLMKSSNPKSNLLSTLHPSFSFLAWRNPSYSQLLIVYASISRKFCCDMRTNAWLQRVVDSVSEGGYMLQKDGIGGDRILSNSGSDSGWALSSDIDGTDESSTNSQQLGR